MSKRERCWWKSIPPTIEVAVEQARAEYADAQAQASAAGINVPITNVKTSSQVSGAQAGVSSAKAAIAAARQQFEAAKSQVAEAEANNVKAQNDLARYKLADRQTGDLAAAIRSSDRQRPGRAPQRCKRRAPAPTHYAAQIKQAQSKLDAGKRRSPRRPTPRRRRCGSCARAPSLRKAIADQKKAAARPGRTEPAVHKDDVRRSAGAVSNRTVEVGQNVQPGQEMMKIIPLDEDNIWVTANFKETQLRKIRPGQRADIEVDATGKNLQGSCRFYRGSQRRALQPSAS